jgi:hypothetical protein
VNQTRIVISQPMRSRYKIRFQKRRLWWFWGTSCELKAPTLDLALMAIARAEGEMLKTMGIKLTRQQKRERGRQLGRVLAR